MSPLLLFNRLSKGGESEGEKRLIDVRALSIGTGLFLKEPKSLENRPDKIKSFK